MNEQGYIKKRLRKAKLQSLCFYMNRVFPITPKKIVFTTIEGTTGYMCNPKYIAEEFIRRNNGYELVWLVNDVTHTFPKEIRVVKNTLWNRAHELSTAKFWIDDSRKQLECRKRKSQIYIQTWHAQLAIKPIGLQRGAAFSRIAYLVSKHDSDMIDYFTTNSSWFTDQLPEGHLYNGKTLKVGSCRCDVLINQKEQKRREIRSRYNLSEDTKLLMYCPTFRSGSQGTNRNVDKGEEYFPDFEKLLDVFRERFSGNWVLLLRLHPQLTVRGQTYSKAQEAGNRIIDVSKEDDMYEILAACDAFLSDYSASSWDAAVMRLPVFLFMKDYDEYIRDRGNLVINPEEHFPCARDEQSLYDEIRQFDEQHYLNNLEQYFKKIDLLEDGHASERVADYIESIM
ncbi:MAG: CDP-glycerol glycerophosphotransferase family protein [Clostridiales bacterium]|nr:CDP-glycerol glycerophosphotransferase family protein [Clostridiales bacterium]